MERVPEPPQLRSLRIGEIFDRATTFYVQNFSVFTLIVLTLLVPGALLRFLLLRDQNEDFSQVFQRILHPAASATLPPSYTAVIVVALVSLFLAPYVNNAVAVGVAMLYQGERPVFATAFRRVFKRGWQLLGTILLCVLLFIVIYVALVFLLIILGVLGGALFGLRGAVAAIFLLVAMLVIVVGLVLTFMTCIFALYATTLEGQPAGRALGQAFGRLFSRRELPKALLMMLAYLALELVAVMVTGAVELLISSFMHSFLVDLIFSTATGAVLNAYVTILLAVYYFDVRTRAEGLDLEVDLARLSSAT